MNSLKCALIQLFAEADYCEAEDDNAPGEEGEGLRPEFRQGDALQEYSPDGNEEKPERN